MRRIARWTAGVVVSPGLAKGFTEVMRSGVREKLGMPRLGRLLAETDTSLPWGYIDASRASAA